MRRQVYRRRPKRIRLRCSCGKLMARDFMAEHVKTDLDYVKPLVSSAAGCNVEQIPEMQRKFPHHVYDRATGDMVFTSHRHRERCLRDLGLVDRS